MRCPSSSVLNPRGTGVGNNIHLFKENHSGPLVQRLYHRVGLLLPLGTIELVLPQFPAEEADRHSPMRRLGVIALMFQKRP